MVEKPDKEDGRVGMRVRDVEDLELEQKLFEVEEKKKEKIIGVRQKGKTISVLLILFLVTMFFAVFYGSWTLLTLSIISLSLMAVGLLTIPSATIDVDISRKKTKVHLHEEDSISVELDIKNMGDKLEFLEVKDELPPKLEVEDGSNYNLFELDKGETKKLKYEVNAPVRGEYSIGPVRLRTRDPFGFFFTYDEREIHQSLHVLPAVESMRKGRVQPRHPKQRSGNIPSGAVGIGSEFFSLREYQPGDMMRNINWKATARSLKPITNEFEGEMSGDVILVVDGFKGSKIGDQKDNTFSATVRAAASLASKILEDRNRVGLILLGDMLSWVYPGYGRKQFYDIINCLSGLSAGGLWELKDVKGLLSQFFPKRCLIIIISPLINTKVTDTVYDITRKEYDALVISPSPLVFELKAGKKTDKLSEKLYSLDREHTMNMLWRYCPVIDWDPREPLEVAVEEVRQYLRRL